MRDDLRLGAHANREKCWGNFRYRKYFLFKVSEYKKAKGGRQSQEVDKKCKRFHIYEGQTVDMMALRMRNELIQDELQEWKKSYCDLESELKKLFQEM